MLQLRAGSQMIVYAESTAHSRVDLPIVFLHGWGGSAGSFADLWAALRHSGVNNRLIAIDFPGFGESPEPRKAWSVQDFADCVVQFLDAAQIERCHLVAHSFGGRVAWKLLSQHPDRFASASLIAVAGIRHQNTITRMEQRARWVKRLFEAPGLRWAFPLVRRFGYRLIGSHDYLRVSGVMKATFQQVVAEDLRAAVAEVRCPTEIFWGQHDTYVPVSDAHLIHQSIPQSRLTIFADGRHGIHRTHAAAIAPIIALTL